MKSKDLIAELQKLDPSGEIEVIADGDIYFASLEPAYYDGCLQTLIRDPALAPYYNIIGMKITGRGQKIQLHCMNMRDVIFDEDEKPLIFDLSELNDNRKERYQLAIDRYREHNLEITQNLDKKDE